MTVWSLVKLTVALWLILLTLAVAAWPLTLTAAAGYTAAWLRGWPPVRLYRAATWTLPVTAAWLAALAAPRPRVTRRCAGPRPGLGAQLGPPGRPDRGAGFTLAAPVAVPAGLIVAGLACARRIYAITTGLNGLPASAPITFDARQRSATNGTPSSPSPQARAPGTW